MNLEQYLEEAKKKEKQRLWDDAILDYEKARVLDTENKEILLALSRLYLFRNKPIQSLEVLHEVSKSHKDADYLLQLSSTYMALQRFEDAYRILLEAVHLHPTPPLLNNLGVVSIRLNKKNEAIEYLSKSLELDSSNPNTWFNLATFYESQGDLDKTSAILQKAKHSSENPDILERLAHILSRKNLYPEAFEEINAAIIRYPEHAGLLKSKLKLLFMSGRYDECTEFIEWLEMEKTLDMDFRKEMLEIKEQVYFNQNKTELCLKTLDDLLHLTQHNPVYFLRKALVYLSQKNYRSALEWSSKLLKIAQLPPNLRSEGIMMMRTIETENWKNFAHILLMDTTFRDALMQNPVYALQSRGILLPEEGMAKIMEWLKNPSSRKYVAFTDESKLLN